MLKRLRSALYFNELQAQTVGFLTCFNVLALLTREGDSPWWLWLIALGFYPFFALLGNFLLNEPPYLTTREK
jgi:hypothetical protein